MELVGYFFAIIIGIVMGLIGGGGSILSVPIFIYVFGMDPLQATTLSLFVVGITSIFGSFGYFRQNLVDAKTAFIFGIPSVISIIFFRKLVVPNLPETLFHIGNFTLSKSLFILLLFALLMLISAFKMIKNTDTEILHASKNNNYTLVISQGIAVGGITGLIGAGGGFLIVPALVMLLGLDIKKAIGTSLVIISMNSLLGFLSSIKHVSIDWNFLLLFTSLSVLGMLIGLFLSKKIEGKKLKPAFGWFVLIMGLYIIFREILFNS